MERIVLICGPSGAGKDTLLKEAREYFKDYPNVNFVTRYITRSPDEFEDNFYVCTRAFNILKESGFFLIDWSAYGYFYGIPKYQIREGCCNFISVSRSAVPLFEQKFEDVHTVLITANIKTIEQRLHTRNRESPVQVRERIKRYFIDFNAKNKIEFKNEGTFQVVREGFISLCQGLILDFFQGQDKK